MSKRTFSRTVAPAIEVECMSASSAWDLSPLDSRALTAFSSADAVSSSTVLRLMDSAEPGLGLGIVRAFAHDVLFCAVAMTISAFLVVVRPGVKVRAFHRAANRVIHSFMVMSNRVLHKKRRGPAPTGKTPATGVRIPEPLRGRLDAWIAAQPEPQPSRSEAIRRLLERALKG